MSSRPSVLNLANLRGLKPATVYHYRLVAVNQSGKTVIALGHTP